MRPLWYLLMAFLLFFGILLPPTPEASRPIDSFRLTSGSQVQGEILNRLLQDMQELAGENSLKPKQRAEIKSLVSQTRLLRQKLNNSSSGSLPLYHQKQLQKIRLRFDAIKNTLPPRPVNIKKPPIALALSPAASPDSWCAQS
jgi:hypothetical protein